MSSLRRYATAVYTSTAVVLLVAAVVEAVWLWEYMGTQDALGADLVFFRDIAQRWVDTGEFYLERQLAGPYVVETLVDVLYPPFALYLFVPFLVLPTLLWWLIPMVAFAAGIARLRPAPWTWPIIAAGIAWPQTVAQVLYGNTNMWVAAAIAAGVAWAWPSVLILLKPSLAPFALIGIHRRRWWVALGILALAAIPFGTLWLDWLTTIGNSSLAPSYALITLPLMLAPIVAWVGRGRVRRAAHLEAEPPPEAVPDVDHMTVAEVE